MEDNSSKKIFSIGFLSGFGAAAIIGCVAFMVWRMPTLPVSETVHASSEPPASSVSEPASVAKPAESPEPSQAPIVIPPLFPSSNAPAASMKPAASSEPAPAVDTPAPSAVSEPAAEPKPKKSYPGEFALLRDSDLLNSLEDEHIQLLYSYFDSYYESLAKLRSNDITIWFSPQTPIDYENMMLNQTVLQMLCGTRAVRENDLSLDEYQYGLTFTGYSRLDDDRVKIDLLEDSRVKFAFLSDSDTDSYTSGIEHSFILVCEDDEWLIESHDRVEDMFIRVWDQYRAARGSKPLSNSDTIVELFYGIYDTVLENALADESSRMEQLEYYHDRRGRIASDGYDCKQPYDRGRAVEYAYTWVDTEDVVRNREWPVYDGNCQNYVSQCLYTGGLSMDCTGASQWKWCGGAINTSQTMSGRSSSWAGVDDFYYYCKYNDERSGIVAQVDANLFMAKPGDVMQLGAFGNWYHSVIVVDEIEGDDDMPIDFLINSNTSDHIDYPLSAYPYSSMRLIHILGSN